MNVIKRINWWYENDCSHTGLGNQTFLGLNNKPDGWSKGGPIGLSNLYSGIAIATLSAKHGLDIRHDLILINPWFYCCNVELNGLISDSTWVLVQDFHSLTGGLDFEIILGLISVQYRKKGYILKGSLVEDLYVYLKHSRQVPDIHNILNIVLILQGKSSQC